MAPHTHPPQTAAQGEQTNALRAWTLFGVWRLAFGVWHGNGREPLDPITRLQPGMRNHRVGLGYGVLSGALARHIRIVIWYISILFCYPYIFSFVTLPAPLILGFEGSAAPVDLELGRVEPPVTSSPFFEECPPESSPTPTPTPPLRRHRIGHIHTLTNTEKTTAASWLATYPPTFGLLDLSLIHI